MLRIRSLILLGVSFLAASAAFADEVGYVDCTAHADASQVFGKPRRSPDVVAELPCGERFTVLVYGFYFSRIQTKDGQVGYIYSSLIAVDRGATAVQHTTTLQPAAEKTKIPSTRATDAQMNPPAPAAQPRTVTTQPVLPAPVTAPSTAATSDAATVAPSATADSATPAPASTASTTSGTSAPAQPEPPAAAPPTPAQPTPAPAVEVAANTATSNPPEIPAPTQPAAQTETVSAPPDAPAATAASASPAPQPEVAAPAEPEPAPAQPPAIKPAIKPAEARASWEKTLPSIRRPPLLELFGGFAFNRMASTGTGYSATNFAGALGSFGFNLKPWLQLVGDSSYNFQTVSGTKTVLYANHYGPRYYYRGLNRLKITPFAEGFVGGTRADVTATGYPTTSQNCISFKVGGGVDYRPSRHWELRLVDVDYYRTSFGTNVHQTNYYISSGIVFRFFGGNE